MVSVITCNFFTTRPTFVNNDFSLKSKRERIVVRKKTLTTASNNKSYPPALPAYNRKVVAEKLNGRLAMLGYVSGSGYELMTGTNYVNQLQENWSYVLLMSLMIGYATFKTRNLDVVEYKPFTTKLEVLNGRLAMFGIVCKILYDSHAFF